MLHMDMVVMLSRRLLCARVCQHSSHISPAVFFSCESALNQPADTYRQWLNDELLRDRCHHEKLAFPSMTPVILSQRVRSMKMLRSRWRAAAWLGSVSTHPIHRVTSSLYHVSFRPGRSEPGAESTLVWTCRTWLDEPNSQFRLAVSTIPV